MTDEREPIDRLADEFLARVRNGERVTAESYAAAHPELADEIRDVFPALLMMEQARPSTDATGDFIEAASVPPPQRLGEYRILRTIGRGGMGVVYEAVQESLGRHVALKVLPTPPPGHDSLLHRFRREARAAARLHHSNIVPVFGVGCDGGINYYVMQYIHGQPLNDVLAEVRKIRRGAKAGDRPASEMAQFLVTNTFVAGDADSGEPGRVSAGSLEVQAPDAHATGLAPGALESSSSLGKQPESRYFRACAKLARQAAEGLAYAHAQGVLHRDIKPSNILLDVHGTAWITDFGLAKFEEEAGLTRTGDIVGTLRYMAPERFRGEGDARSDVYALGITLYEMLTLEPAFSANDRLELIEQVTQTTPAPPRSVDRRLPRDLDTIVQKAIAREPAERYANAAALADDLGRFLNDQPIKARRQSMVERTVKWAKRRPAVASLIAVSVLAAATLIGGGVYYNALLQVERGRVGQQASELDRQETELNAARDRVRITEEDAAYKLARSDFWIAAGLHQQSKPLDTLVSLNRIPEEHRQWEWRCLQRQAQGSDVTLWGHTAWVSSVAFSPDGARLASGSADNTIKLWDARSGALVHTLTGHTSGVLSVAFSPDGARLASGSHDDTIKLWDARSGALVHTLTGHTSGVSSVAFSPDGQRLASGSHDDTIKLWDARSGALVHTLTGHTSQVLSVAFSPDGARLASGSHDDTIKLWDARSGALVHTLTGHTSQVLSVAFSPDGARLASGSHDDTIKLWDARSGALVHTLTGHTNSVSSVAFSPDGQRLASRDQGENVKVWDIVAGKEISDPKGADWLAHAGNSSRSPDGLWYAIGHGTGAILLVKPVTPDAVELGYREGMARFDAKWADDTENKLLNEGRWFGALFHRDQLIAHGGKPHGDTRAWELWELGRWQEAVNELRQILPGEVAPNETWPVAVQRLAIGDKAGFAAYLAKRRKKYLTGAPAAVLASQLMAGSALEAVTLNRVRRAWEVGVNDTVVLGCLSNDPRDIDGLDPWCASVVTRGVLDIRQGKHANVLKHVAKPGAAHYLWQALAELNRPDAAAARKQLDQAEAWLVAADERDKDRPNASSMGWDNRLLVELLRREVRTKLGLNPDEPLPEAKR